MDQGDEFFQFEGKKTKSPKKRIVLEYKPEDQLLFSKKKKILPVVVSPQIRKKTKTKISTKKELSEDEDQRRDDESEEKERRDDKRIEEVSEDDEVQREDEREEENKKRDEELCEEFIKISSRVMVKDKFKNPFTNKLLTKGSAAYKKYLKDCQDKLSDETKQQLADEKESDIKKFGIRKIYRCEDYKLDNAGRFEPNPHQIKARKRFSNILEGDVPGVRGLLLYYGLGSGKTCTYAMIADLYHQKYPNRAIFVFTPGSLRTNFLEQYCSFCGMNPSEISKTFSFYSLNDTTILRKIPKKMDKSLVIIDEVHKLTHGKANESAVISLIYDIINNSENVNIVSGSGTPIETNLEELFYLTNLHMKDKFDVMPEFKSLFKWKEGVFYPKNKDKLIELFSMFISYYDPQKRLETTDKKSFPTVYYKNVYVPINPEREREYMELVSAESEQIKKPNEDLKYRDYERYKKQKQKYFIAVSRLRSAQESNFNYPLIFTKKPKSKVEKGAEKASGKGNSKGKEEQIQEQEKEVDRQSGALPEGEPLDISNITEGLVSGYDENTPIALGVPDNLIEKGGWITKNLLKDLYDQGEKINQIVDDIKTNEGKHAVYTRFKTYYGSRLLGSILDLMGITYVYFDGDMDDKARVDVLERFNAVDNINGNKIKVIILTSAGSAGINLKEIRRFHILEQYFNLSYLKQVVGRGNRYLSHQRLPENKRNLTVLNYFLALSDDELTQKYSSDVLSYKTGKQKDNSISAVRELLTSLDI